jgi:hypothetical protein
LRGATLAAALLCAVLGLSVSAYPGARTTSLVTLVASATAAAMIPLRSDFADAIFLGCWTSVVVTAVTVYLRRPPGSLGPFALSLNAGCWSGAVIALAGSWPDLLKALPCVLLVFPAAWTVRRGATVAVKVLASWLIAVALLAVTLQLLPVTPGYLPDHID